MYPSLSLFLTVLCFIVQTGLFTTFLIFPTHCTAFPRTVQYSAIAQCKTQTCAYEYAVKHAFVPHLPPIYTALPYPTLPYYTLPYPTLLHPTLPYPTLLSPCLTLCMYACSALNSTWIQKTYATRARVIS